MTSCLDALRFSTIVSRPGVFDSGSDLQNWPKFLPKDRARQVAWLEEAIVHRSHSDVSVVECKVE